MQRSSIIQVGTRRSTVLSLSLKLVFRGREVTLSSLEKKFYFTKGASLVENASTGTRLFGDGESDKNFDGATTFSITSLGIMTLSIMTPNLSAPSIMTRA
jgi:hypothetical protein